VAVNDKLAFRAFLQAAQHGYFAAACYLGLMYSYGEYVEKSQEKAFLWYRIGALHGDANSQYDLSKCLRYGEGCQVDRNFADLWLMIAAKNGSIEAREYLKGIVNKTIS
jgi:TPR repeat protein